MARAQKPKQVSASHPLAIHCERHGVTAYCLICQHLRAGEGLGYFAIPPESDEPAQAWCETCDEVLQEEQGWSERADSQADWKLYCAGCYDETLVKHEFRSWVQGTNPEDFA